MCYLGLQEPRSLVVLAHCSSHPSLPPLWRSLSSLPQTLCHALSLPVSIRLHPGLLVPRKLSGSRSLSWALPRAPHFGVVIPLSGQTGNLHFGSESSPPTFFQVPLSFSPSTNLGENVSGRRELDTLCGLSKRENADNSERRREVRLLAELPHDLRTGERCGEWVRSLELLFLRLYVQGVGGR